MILAMLFCLGGGFLIYNLRKLMWKDKRPSLWGALGNAIGVPSAMALMCLPIILEDASCLANRKTEKTSVVYQSKNGSLASTSFMAYCPEWCVNVRSPSTSRICFNGHKYDLEIYEESDVKLVAHYRDKLSKDSAVMADSIRQEVYESTEQVVAELRKLKGNGDGRILVSPLFGQPLGPSKRPKPGSDEARKDLQEGLNHLALEQGLPLNFRVLPRDPRFEGICKDPEPKENNVKDSREWQNKVETSSASLEGGKDDFVSPGYNR